MAGKRNGGFCYTILYDPNERANFWTHAVAAVAFLAYGLVRLGMYAEDAQREGAITEGQGVAVLDTDDHDLGTYRSGTIGEARLAHVVSILLLAALFCASAAFHSAGENMVASAYLRWIDGTLIFVTFGAIEVADVLAAATARLDDDNDDNDEHCLRVRTSWQAWADPIFVATVSAGAFTLVRFTRSPAATWDWVGYDHSGTDRDTLRRGHVDGDFAPARAVLLVISITQWVCALAYEYEYLPTPFGAVLLVTKGLGALVVVTFAANDVHELTDRRIALWPTTHWLQRHVPLSHTLWHVMATALAAVLCGLRDAALVRRARLNGC